MPRRTYDRRARRYRPLPGFSPEALLKLREELQEIARQRRYAPPRSTR